MFSFWFILIVVMLFGGFIALMLLQGLYDAVNQTAAKKHAAHAKSVADDYKKRLRDAARKRGSIHGKRDMRKWKYNVDSDAYSLR